MEDNDPAAHCRYVLFRGFFSGAGFLSSTPNFKIIITFEFTVYLLHYFLQYFEIGSNFDTVLLQVIVCDSYNLGDVLEVSAANDGVKYVVVIGAEDSKEHDKVIPVG